MNGYICCTVRGDLVVALKKLYKRVEQFNAVIIESTVLADPVPNDTAPVKDKCQHGGRSSDHSCPL